MRKDAETYLHFGGGRSQINKLGKDEEMPGRCGSRGGEKGITRYRGKREDRYSYDCRGGGVLNKTSWEIRKKDYRRERL